MDLSAIKPATQKVEIIHPGSARPTGLVIEVTSAESDAVKRVVRRHIDFMIRGRGRKMSADKAEEHMIEKLAAAVVAWEWNGDAAWGGKKLECTPENVSLVLGTEWIRRQVGEVVEDEAGFFTS